MKMGRLLFFENAKSWRDWLKKNSVKEKDAWLLFYKKNSGKKGMEYEDAVREALCYGWIDSTVKRIDEFKHAQHFTPRRKNSVLSQLNKRRIQELIKQGKMTKKGLDAIKDSKEDTLTEVDTVNLPKDLEAELIKMNALEKFHNLPYSQKKMHLFSLLTAKRKETRQKRILRAAEYAKNNKRIF